MHTHYRYASKDGGYQTRWRRVPADGIEPPSKPAQERLGPGYALHLRNGRKRASRISDEAHAAGRTRAGNDISGV